MILFLASLAFMVDLEFLDDNGHCGIITTRKTRASRKGKDSSRKLAQKQIGDNVCLTWKWNNPILTCLTGSLSTTSN